MTTFDPTTFDAVGFDNTSIVGSSAFDSGAFDLNGFDNGIFTPSVSPITIDGPNKIITVNAGISTINVRRDLYSEWVDWLVIDDNLKYLPAMRVIGGDPVGPGLYAGDIYFLTNGWKINITHMVNIVGTLYTEEGDSPYIVQPGGGVIATVSNLAYGVSTTGASSSAPTVAEIVHGVWSTPLSTLTDKTTIGGYIAKVLLSVPKFLGLQ